MADPFGNVEHQAKHQPQQMRVALQGPGQGRFQQQTHTHTHTHEEEGTTGKRFHLDALSDVGAQKSWSGGNGELLDQPQSFKLFDCRQSRETPRSIRAPAMAAAAAAAASFNIYITAEREAAVGYLFGCV
eukprot:scaffold41931_cov24-Tisochrysis_lutea.AAC.1